MLTLVLRVALRTEEYILVNPTEMVAALTYAASKIEEVEDTIAIFIVDGNGNEKAVSVSELNAANITAGSRQAVSTTVNTLLEKKRLAEELEATKAELEALKRARTDGASA